MPVKDPGSDGTGKDALKYLQTVLHSQRDPIWFIKNVLGIPKLYPMQEHTIREFYRDKYNPALPRYNHMVYVGGMRGGKTAEASMIGCYEAFNVLSKPNPAEHWGLLPNQLVSGACLASSKDQIQDGVFYNITNMLECSEWINQWYDIDYRSSDIFCDAKNFRIRALSSSPNMAAGRSNVFVLFDELDLFEGENGTAKAWEAYNILKKSTVTFGPDGRTIAISSPKTENGIILTLYKRATMRKVDGGVMQPNVYALRIPTWEMNPSISKESLLEEFKFDMDSFYKDFACDPSSASAIQFPNGMKMYRRPNILANRQIPPPSPISHVLAIDPAWRNDAYGIAVGYRDWNRGVTVVDGVTSLKKEEGQQYLRPSVVKEYVGSLIDNLHITDVIFDAWLSVELIEYCQYERHLNVVQNIVEEKEYNLWRDGQESGACEVVYDEMLKYEAERLTRKRLQTKIRVDHPKDGSKDMADCVANIIQFFADERVQPVNRAIGLRSF